MIEYDWKSRMVLGRNVELPKNERRILFRHDFHLKIHRQLAVSERVLVIWYDRHEEAYVKAKVLTLDAEAFDESSDEVRLLNVLGHWFGASALSHQLPQSTLDMTSGWVVAADNAPVLLTVLRWLTGEQREEIYRLVSDQPYPHGWLQEATKLMEPEGPCPICGVV